MYICTHCMHSITPVVYSMNTLPANCSWIRKNSDKNSWGIQRSKVWDHRSQTFSGTTFLSWFPACMDQIIWMNKSTLYFAAIWGRLLSSANSVRLYSLLQIVHEFHKFPAKKPGLLYQDQVHPVNTASWLFVLKRFF